MSNRVLTVVKVVKGAFKFAKAPKKSLFGKVRAFLNPRRIKTRLRVGKRGLFKSQQRAAKELRKQFSKRVKTRQSFGSQARIRLSPRGSKRLKLIRRGIFKRVAGTVVTAGVTNEVFENRKLLSKSLSKKVRRR